MTIINKIINKKILIKLRIIIINKIDKKISIKIHMMNLIKGNCNI